MRCRRFPPTPESPRRNRFTRRFQLPHERPHRKLTTAPPFRKSQRPLSLHYPNHHPILKSLVLSDFDAAALKGPVHIRLLLIGTHSDCFWPLLRSGSGVRRRSSSS